MTSQASLPLMPKATAVWLVENTTLTFDQIAEFCGMHPLEVQGVADGDVASGVIGQDPVANGILTTTAIEAAEADEKAKLQMRSDAKEYITAQRKQKRGRYTPVAHRQDKPDAIAWLIKNYPDIKDSQISRLVGTTKKTITAIREKEHWNMANIRPRDPVLLGLCTQTALEAVAAKLRPAIVQDVEEQEA